MTTHAEIRRQALEDAARFVETHKVCQVLSKGGIRPLKSGELPYAQQIEYANAIRSLIRPPAGKPSIHDDLHQALRSSINGDSAVI